MKFLACEKCDTFVERGSPLAGRFRREHARCCYKGRWQPSPGEAISWLGLFLQVYKPAYTDMEQLAAAGLERA